MNPELSPSPFHRIVRALGYESDIIVEVCCEYKRWC